MTNYVKTVDFLVKDGLASGDPLKIVRGQEHDTEYNNIAAASASKMNSADPVFSGEMNGVDITLSGFIRVGVISGGTI